MNTNTNASTTAAPDAGLHPGPPMAARRLEAVPVALHFVEFATQPDGNMASVEAFVATASYPLQAGAADSTSTTGTAGATDIVDAPGAGSPATHDLRVTFHFTLPTAATNLRLLAEWLEIHTAHGASCSVALQSGALAENVAHPLTYLQFAEEGITDNPLAARWPAHAWGLEGNESAGYTVWFEHGAYGTRDEPAANAAAAFKRLAMLASGVLTWDTFGSEQSRRTLLHKGQFYWRQPEPWVFEPSDGMVPVDNFIFRGNDGSSLRLAAVGERSVLSWGKPDGESEYEWFDDTSEALVRMADVLAGNVAPSSFGGWAEDLASLPVTASEREQETAPWTGHFVVREVLEEGDTHVADVLHYQTQEGKTAGLQKVAEGWQVKAWLSSPNWREAKYGVDELPQALRCLANVLRDGLAPGPLFAWE